MKAKKKVDVSLIHWPQEPFTVQEAFNANEYIGRDYVSRVLSQEVDNGNLRIESSRGKIKMRHAFPWEKKGL